MGNVQTEMDRLIMERYEDVNKLVMDKMNDDGMNNEE